MLTFQWVSIGAAVLVAVVALLQARRSSRRLERLTESYWELRYEYGLLRARVARLEGQSESEGQPAPTAQAGPTSFVPLSSLKR